VKLYSVRCLRERGVAAHTRSEEGGRWVPGVFEGGTGASTREWLGSSRGAATLPSNEMDLPPSEDYWTQWSGD
jgi:hypothetical protein